MSALAISTNTTSMTSREIAQLTGKEHKNVLRDIRALCDSIKDGSDLNHELNQQVTIETDARGYMSLATMQKDFVLTLLTGYDAKARFRVIKRWQELETAPAPTVPRMDGPEQRAVAMLESRLSAAALLKVPEHIAQQEAVKAVEHATGVDYQPLLLAAPAQQMIAAQDEMLEPEDLARRLGELNGRTMNLKLCDAGFQIKEQGQWLPTEKGAPHCVKHAWTRGKKSGYNLKWRVDAVQKVCSNP